MENSINLSQANTEYINRLKKCKTQDNPIEAETKQKKFPKKAMLIGGACLAGIIVGGLIFKGQLDKAKKIAEHINFSDAKTIEEAIAFGKNNLKIEGYIGFNDKSLKHSLESINLINEGLVNISNSMRGKAKLPKKIFYADLNEIILADVSTSGELRLNKNIFENLEKYIEKALERCQKVNAIKIQNNKIIPHNIFKQSQNVKGMIDDLEKLSQDKLSFKKQVALFNDLLSLGETGNALFNSPIVTLEKLGVTPEKLEEYKSWPLDKQKEFVRKLLQSASSKGKLQVDVTRATPFKTIYHEMGHAQDKLLASRCATAYSVKDPDKYPEYLKKWLDDEETIQIANSVSKYATAGPGEFIAETFAKLVEGRKLPQSVMNLYEKMQGPKVFT